MDYSYRERYAWKRTSIDELLGKTLIQITGMEKDSEEIRFICSDGSEYIMYHDQDCCESVTLEDVCGDVSCLVGTPITKAEESCNSEDPPGTEGYEPDSYTWTYYHLATIKGYVDLRWYGESNGYYSENVDFYRTKNERSVTYEAPMPSSCKEG